MGLKRLMFLLVGLILIPILNVVAQFKVIGYLPSWGNYPTTINAVDLTKLTHINIAFANPNASGDLSTSNGTLGNLATVVTAAHAQNVKVLMSIGGAGAPGTIYRDLINTNLASFVTKIVQYAVDNNLDGIDVDIEGDVLNGTTLTSTQYENFILALGVGLQAQNKLMTAALATWFAFRVTNLAASKFDFINVMSYDEYGTWTGPGQHSTYSLAVSDLSYWNSTKAVPTSKLVIGVPFYGYFWGNSSSSYTFSDVLLYYPGSQNLDKVIPSTGGVLYYNGIPTIKQKTVLAIEQAAGIMIWQLVGDATGANSLLAAIDEVVDGYSGNTAPTISITAPSATTLYAEGDTVKIETNAADLDGSIMKVEYFAGTFKIGEVYTAPFNFNWVGAGPAAYSITAKATDNIGKTVASAVISITVNQALVSSPYTGTPISIPGKVEAENFNLGGNTIGYYDLTTTNLGGCYRTSNVDIEECVDNGGTFDVGWIDTGEWLEYSVDVTSSGNYDFQVRVANGGSTGTFHIEMNGVDITGLKTVAPTGGWQKWQTITIQNITLTSGLKKMKFVMNASGFNLNYISVVPSVVSSITNVESAVTKNYFYPNPIAQTSILHFTLQRNSHVKVVMYDSMGKMVLLVANESMVSGENEVMIKRGDLPSGIYTCKILAGDELIGSKVVLE